MEVPVHDHDLHSLSPHTTAAPHAAFPARVASTVSRDSSHTSRRKRSSSGRSSAEDVSASSDTEPDHDYQTDFTTPACSESHPDDMQPDDVEDFRDKEYPQLKGKTYLDHGGTTVRTQCFIGH